MPRRGRRIHRRLAAVKTPPVTQRGNRQALENVVADLGPALERAAIVEDPYVVTVPNIATRSVVRVDKDELFALAAPLMDVSRARSELGWSARRSASDALLDLLEGMREGAGLDTPPLEPGGAGPLRAREFAGGVGARTA